MDWIVFLSIALSPEVNPSIAYRTAAITVVGTIALRLCLRCCIRGTLQAEAVSSGVSEAGEIASPTYDPETIAPTTIAGLSPRPSPTPIIAIPAVLIVPHDVPVGIARIAQNRNARQKNILGVIRFSPQ